MPSIAEKKSALFWAIGWWFVRRWLRRRASHALAGVAAGAASRRDGFRTVARALALVAALAGAFLLWRRLSGSSDDGQTAELPVEPPFPPEAVGT